MQKINITKYGIICKNKENKTFVYDSIRKKYVLLTKEEEVRQRYIKYLEQEKKYTLSNIGVEVQFKLFHIQKRADIVVYNSKMNPKIVIECKAPDVVVNNSVLKQAMEYAIEIQPLYIVLTNGIYQWVFRKDIQGRYKQIEDLPKR